MTVATTAKLRNSISAAGTIAGSVSSGTAANPGVSAAGAISSALSSGAMSGSVSAAGGFAVPGTVPIAAVFAATETPDTAVFFGPITGTFAATDVGDTAAFAGAVPVDGDLAATEATDTAALAGVIPVSGALAATEAADVAAFEGELVVPLTLTQKGYGSKAQEAGVDLTLSYGTVIDGSAPEAGDLVIWLVRASDTASDPTTAPSGWEKAFETPPASSLVWVGGFAKIIEAGDLSSPPLGVDDGFGALGMWIAYSITGTATGIAIGGLDSGGGGGAAPGDTVIDASGVEGPMVVASLGTGTDDALTLVWTGATEDASASANNLSSTIDAIAKWKAYAAGVSGDSITLSKGDDGGGNTLVGFYVTVS